jgi:ribonuclease D
METRVQNIRKSFKDDKLLFLASFTPTNQETKVDIHKLEKVEKVKAKEMPPLMMKKIRRFKEDSKKNNLKRVQKPFEYHGDIDDYEKELISRISPKEKEIE